jgi:L-amino acid N-acyltransferase
MRIRLADIADSEAIRAIYNAEVLGATNTFDMVPRTKAEQLAWLEGHSQAHPCVVATLPAGSPGEFVGAQGEMVLGFGSLSPYRDRPAYATTAENSVYVDESARGQGIGRALLDELLVLAAGHGFHTVIARIVGENEASIALHKACGFELVGVEREVGRKHRRWLDVVELQRML